MEEREYTGTASAPDAAGDFAPDSEPLQLPATAIALAGKARDLLALRDAVVDAASVGTGLWLSYLFVFVYLFIAVGSITHYDLFLGSRVSLPFLQLNLPLLGFFWLGPAIFLIVHAYVLLHFVMLAGKVGDFDTELRAQIIDGEVRGRLRRQLPSNIFVQFLAGSREMRSGGMGFLLRLIAQISLVMAPIALLVFFELQFLPYHDELLSWWHRVAVLADIGLLWALWPSIAKGQTSGLAWREFRRGKIIALVCASFAPVVLVTAIATFPGEWVEGGLPSLRLIPWKDQSDKPWRLASLHELLVGGEVDLAARKPKSLWSNRLVLPGFDAIVRTKFDSEAKIESLAATISLRARHLEGAVLTGASLRKADFTAAQLQGAQFDQSDLRGVKFECASSTFFIAGIKIPKCTNLQGASLVFAQLQGASLAGAQLAGARLDGAKLQGASLWYAHLEGASLISAELQGAALMGASLQGTWLTSANLQGVRLDHAQLDGALLDRANLQGAMLDGAVLQGASLKKVLAWRADARGAVWGDTRVFEPDIGQAEWSAKSFENLKELEIKWGGMERLDPTKALEGEQEMGEVWNVQARSPPSKEAYEKRLSAIWQETGCAAQWAPYVVRQLLFRLLFGSMETNFEQPSYIVTQETNGLHFVLIGSRPFDAASPEKRALAKAFLDEERCPGARGITGDEKSQLELIGATSKQ